MDYGFADKGVVIWSDSQGRYELKIYENGGRDHLYTWLLPPGFEAPDIEIQPLRWGIEEINARLADAKIFPSGAKAWEKQSDGSWILDIHPRRARNANDH
jgi:hypothetical protein